MATIGTDCQIILDGVGYWIEPATFTVARPRVRRADLNGQAANAAGPGTGAGERYVDRGPGKRVWQFIAVCFNSMRDYSGSVVATTGQAFHDSLQTSYN